MINQTTIVKQHISQHLKGHKPFQLENAFSVLSKCQSMMISKKPLILFV
ncbi:hypothetical protein ACEQPO_30400 [Bacillus sp. SL00103]